MGQVDTCVTYLKRRNGGGGWNGVFQGQGK